MNIVNNLPEVPPGLEDSVIEHQETDVEDDEEGHEDISWYDEVDNEEEDNEEEAEEDEERFEGWI